MAASLPDVDDLSVDELKKLVLRLLEGLSALRAENAALREEIARLKGLKGRPKIRPSGMEKGTDARPTGGTANKRRGRGAKRVLVTEERVIRVAALAGWRFKGYETTVVQDLVVRPMTIHYRRERWQTPRTARRLWCRCRGGCAAMSGPSCGAWCWRSTTRDG